MKQLLGLVALTFLVANTANAWQIPKGIEFESEEKFTQFLLSTLDCDLVPGSEPVPVEGGVRIPWGGHSYLQLKDGSWAASGAMLCHDPLGDGKKPKLYIYNWTVGFELRANRSIVTNGKNTRAYQGYDYDNIPRP